MRQRATRVRRLLRLVGRIAASSRKPSSPWRGRCAEPIRAHPAARLCGPLAALALAGGCQPLERESPSLALLRFPQAGDAGVFLNESLIFHFDGELDPASVTRETVQILGPGGVRAAGEFEVQRNQLRFHPFLPKASDLSDGGFRPGTQYEVILRGFPLPDGLRGRAGDPLERGYRSSFRTAERGGPRAQQLFADPTIDRAQPLVLRTPVVRPSEPLVLECAEPLDPTTLFAEDFQLLVLDEEDPIELRAELVVNQADLARIELFPVAREFPGEPRELRPGDAYYLLLDPSTSRLRDFGGHSVSAAWSRPAAVQVEAPDRRGPLRSLRVDFLPPFRPTPEALDGADGGLAWDGDVTVVLPRSSGTGADGNVELGATLAEADVHATRLSLGAGVLCAIEASGPVVLRAQGRMEIAGRLERGGGAVDESLRPSQVLSDWLEERRADGVEGGVRVEEWIAHLSELGLPYTLLVAGGDLVISGEIEVDGPLILVAGGLIRATGSVRAQRAHRIGRGGGPHAKLTPLGLDQVVMEPMRENQLADTYRFSVLSSPIRPPGGVRRWGSALVRVYQGLGTVRVRFLGERPGGGGPQGEYTDPVDDLAELDDADAVRLRIDVEVGPGAVWDPPRVDFVELRYE